MRNVAASAVMSAVGFAAACSSPPPPKVAKPKSCELKSLKASLIAAAKLNLSEEREPRPVQLRLYQLKNDTRFLNARFDAVWRSDAEVLGDDLLKVDELPVYPNSRVELNVEKEEGARFLVAAGLFRNPKGRSWFTSFEFPEASATFCEDESGETSVPEFYVWVEGTRVEEGSAHADEFPEGAGRVMAMDPPPSAPKTEGAEQGPPSGGGDVPSVSDVASGAQDVGKAAQSAPAVPGAPQAPTTPSAPNVGGGMATELR